MGKIKFYINLFKNDRSAFWFQLWMVYNRYRLGFLIKLSRLVNASKHKFVTVHTRPIEASDSNLWSDPLLTEPKTAIVMQGRVITDRNFTLETVRWYKKTFKTTAIIVSTDTDTDPKLVNSLKEAGAEIVLTDRPAVRGLGNVNLQLVSTLAGIKAAKEIGAEFVYKTRTDQRMYGLNINEFLINLIKAFPLKVTSSQKYRIIASSFLSQKFVPYLITDMWQFGQIDDMLDFWGTPLDTRTAAPVVRTLKEGMEAKIAEVYLVTEYMKKIGRTVKWSLQDSWEVYAEHFCIVDKETLDLFWYKYESYLEYGDKKYTAVSNSQLLTFAEWFNLYSNLSNKADIPERTLAEPRFGFVPEKSK